jgi:hypothetical protein
MDPANRLFEALPGRLVYNLMSQNVAGNNLNDKRLMVQGRKGNSCRDSILIGFIAMLSGDRRRHNVGKGKLNSGQNVFYLTTGEAMD